MEHFSDINSRIGFLDKLSVSVILSYKIERLYSIYCDEMPNLKSTGPIYYNWTRKHLQYIHELNKDNKLEILILRYSDLISKYERLNLASGKAFLDENGNWCIERPPPHKLEIYVKDINLDGYRRAELISRFRETWNGINLILFFHATHMQSNLQGHLSNLNSILSSLLLSLVDNIWRNDIDLNITSDKNAKMMKINLTSCGVVCRFIHNHQSLLEYDVASSKRVYNSDNIIDVGIIEWLKIWANKVLLTYNTYDLGNLDCRVLKLAYTFQLMRFDERSFSSYDANPIPIKSLDMNREPLNISEQEMEEIMHSRVKMIKGIMPYDIDLYSNKSRSTMKLADSFEILFAIVYALCIKEDDMEIL